MTDVAKFGQFLDDPDIKKLIDIINPLCNTRVPQSIIELNTLFKTDEDNYEWTADEFLAALKNRLFFMACMCKAITTLAGKNEYDFSRIIEIPNTNKKFHLYLDKGTGHKLSFFPQPVSQMLSQSYRTAYCCACKIKVSTPTHGSTGAIKIGLLGNGLIDTDFKADYLNSQIEVAVSDGTPAVYIKVLPLKDFTKEKLIEIIDRSDVC